MSLYLMRVMHLLVWNTFQKVVKHKIIVDMSPITAAGPKVKRFFASLIVSVTYPWKRLIHRKLVLHPKRSGHKGQDFQAGLLAQSLRVGRTHFPTNCSSKLLAKVNSGSSFQNYKISNILLLLIFDEFIRDSMAIADFKRKLVSFIRTLKTHCAKYFISMV